MDLRVFTEPQQGASYEDLLRVARASEELGFDAFFRSDHYKRIGPGDPGPGSTEAWVTLGASRGRVRSSGRGEGREGGDAGRAGAAGLPRRGSRSRWPPVVGGTGAVRR